MIIMGIFSGLVEAACAIGEMIECSDFGLAVWNAKETTVYTTIATCDEVKYKASNMYYDVKYSDTFKKCKDVVINYGWQRVSDGLCTAAKYAMRTIEDLVIKGFTSMLELATGAHDVSKTVVDFLISMGITQLIKDGIMKVGEVLSDIILEAIATFIDKNKDKKKEC